MIALDLETCGLVGPPVTIQWSEDRSEPRIHEVWRESRESTLNLIRYIVQDPDGVLGFNLTFDWFHLQRLYNILLLGPIQDWQQNCLEAINGPCIKPKSALDLFLWARKGPYQTLMARDDIRIRRVPRLLASALADELYSSLKLEPVFFSRRKDGYRWTVEGEEPHIADVVLRFAGSGGLKPLARHVFKEEFPDLPLKNFPQEDLWNPHSPGWLAHIDAHIRFWAENEEARRYARNDVALLWRLWDHFGRPVFGDDDSVLACQVASSRWRGYELDLEALPAMLEAAEARCCSNTSPAAVMAALRELAPVEAMGLTDTTSETLERVAKWPGHAGQYAARIIDARSAEKEIQVLKKLAHVGRAHFDFKVVGALSGRMSGAGNLNPQGIPKGPMRNLFTMAKPGQWLSGGDMIQFEIAIAAATYNDPALNEELRRGKSFHGLLGSALFSQDYDRVLSERKAPDSVYNRAKTIAFAGIYGAQKDKIDSIAGFDTAGAMEVFYQQFPGIKRAQEADEARFCALSQPGGMGTPVIWREPQMAADSLFGYTRRFDLEFKIARALFELAQDPPEHLQSLVRVKRANRNQSATGALQSALYGSAFGIQARITRAAKNHKVQATGAAITKRVQRVLWDQFQPGGEEPWKIQPMNIHDELMCPHEPSLPLETAAKQAVESFRDSIPRIGIDWKTNMRSWGEK